MKPRSLNGCPCWPLRTWAEKDGAKPHRANLRRKYCVKASRTEFDWLVGMSNLCFRGLIVAVTPKTRSMSVHRLEVVSAKRADQRL
jgi:hypothetical protein